jgi:hypothetical protein
MSWNIFELDTWRGHSCLQRRDSSRRFSHRFESNSKERVVLVLAISGVRSEKRREESRRCRHECPRHVLGPSTFHSQARRSSETQARLLDQPDRAQFQSKMQPGLRHRCDRHPRVLRVLAPADRCRRFGGRHGSTSRAPSRCLSIRAFSPSASSGDRWGNSVRRQNQDTLAGSVFFASR